MFELTTGDTVRAYSDAVLGKQELLTERLASFRPKPALVDRIRGLADQVMLFGPTHSSLEHPVVLEASDKALTARLTCEWRETDDWTAYCHSSGLAIRISTQVYEQEGQQGREHGIGFDQSVRFSDIWGTEVESFMLNCHPDGSLFVSVEAEGSKIRGQLDGPALVQLAARGAASRATRVLRDAGIVDMSGRSVESLTPDEFGTLLLLETAISGFDFLAGGGFALGETGWEKLLEESVRLRVPICGNLNGRGVVVWADVEGSLLWEPARKRICGLKFRKLIRHEIEWGDDVFRIGGYPEIKVCAAWPGIPANFVMDETVHVGPEDDWGVELAWEDLEPPSGGEAGAPGSQGPTAGGAGLNASLPEG